MEGRRGGPREGGKAGGRRDGRMHGLFNGPDGGRSNVGKGAGFKSITIQQKFEECAWMPSGVWKAKDSLLMDDRSRMQNISATYLE